MTDSLPAAVQKAQRFPLSLTQEWFLGMDKGDDVGSFGSRFIQTRAVRVTGPVDLAVLQGALDDVVARHEMLRSTIVRDADPPYQLVFPPCQVPLEVRDMPPAPGKSVEEAIGELIYTPEPISARGVPLIRGRLWRFSDRDSVLFVIVHHIVSDAWSLEVIMRDLGACYAARATGAPVALPPVREYREFAEWQRANATSTAADGAPAYWRDKLRGAREFTVPNDHGHPDKYSSPYSLHTFGIEADIMAGAAALATAARTTVFTVLLSAFYVHVHEMTGVTDLALRALTAGREQERFHDTVGVFLNSLPLRTDLADCSSFRDIVERARDTFFDAIAHEIPINMLERTFPDYVKSREDLGTSEWTISYAASQLGEDLIYPIAEGAREQVVRWREEDALRDIPSGVVWGLHMPPGGDLLGGILFNVDELDESTVAGWVAAVRRILASAVRDPDQDWKTL